MTLPYICAACRSLRLQLRNPRDQRRWLSSSAFRRRDHYFTDVKRPIAARDIERGPRGRYSRQPLQPDAILDDLNAPPTDDKPKRRQSQGRRDGARRPNYDRKYELQRGRQERVREPNQERKEDLDTQHDQDARHHLMQLKKIAERWKRRTIEAQANGVSHEAGTSNSRPGPLKALRTYTSSYPSERVQYPLVLWPASVAVFELHAQACVPRTIILEGIRELMSIWNLAMAVQLSRYPLDVSELRVLEDNMPNLDWSFLPSPSVFASFIRQQQRDTRSTWSLTEALATLVPYHSPHSPRTSSEEIYDDRASVIVGQTYQQSAALVTLDLLHTIQRDTDFGLEGIEVLEENKAWMQLMEGVLDAMKDKTVPTTLKQRMIAISPEELRMHYRNLVKRKGLDFHAAKPSISTQADPTVQQTPQDMQNDHDIAKMVEPSVDDVVEVFVNTQPSNTDELPFDGSRMDPTDFNFFALLSKRLGRVIEKQDLRGAQNDWNSLKDYVTSKPDSSVGVPLGLYELCLSTFMALRSRATALEVWNHMTGVSEHEPRCKTYTVMMRGCVSMRDLKGMEALWARMKERGVRPDSYAWTTRIFGLLKSRTHVDLGLGALSEMGRDWVNAARAAYARDRASANQTGKQKPTEVMPSELLAIYAGDVDGVTRPSVEVMNASLSALASSNHSVVPKVLSWARSFGIDPDIRSYNVLINLSMRNGQPEEALNILRTMQQKEVEVNSTTWTVLLSALFKGGYFENLDAADLEQKILSFIESLNSASTANIDEKGYALIIDRVLKLYGNSSAAQAVLKHMSEKGVKPTPHIYTILMASYFNQSPPDLAAVDALWSQIQVSNDGYGVPLDNVFYDRMIEGYAANVQTIGTAPLLQSLSRVEKEGRLLSWTALEAAARALDAHQEWDRLSQMVESVRRRWAERINDQRLSKGMSYGQKSFWQFIYETGLFADQRVRRRKDVTL